MVILLDALFHIPWLTLILLNRISPRDVSRLGMLRVGRPLRACCSFCCGFCVRRDFFIEALGEGNGSGCGEGDTVRLALDSLG